MLMVPDMPTHPLPASATAEGPAIVMAGGLKITMGTLWSKAEHYQRANRGWI